MLTATTATPSGNVRERRAAKKQLPVAGAGELPSPKVGRRTEHAVIIAVDGSSPVMNGRLGFVFYLRRKHCGGGTFRLCGNRG